MIQGSSGGRGRDGEHKKVILISATPVNNDLYDLANQLRLFTQSRPDYFREVAAVFAQSAGGPPDLARIGDVMRRHGLTPAGRPPA